jgi:AraC family transcriptional regulator, regulatory protein of adaptative response / DNA-3-methyladenine glycosylase II
VLTSAPQQRSALRWPILCRRIYHPSLLPDHLPVPLRKSQNILWFPTAASARAAGFRPYRRCNPHISPGTPAWLGTAAVVGRAIRLILDGRLDDNSVEALAARVGIGPRHLHRLFTQHLGISPLKLAQIRRVNLAHRLIEETESPLADVAFRAGFKSVRQFNQVIHAAFDASPSRLRRSRRTGASTRLQAGIVISLPYRPPLDWPELIHFLEPRLTPGVETIVDSCYRRNIEIDGDVGEIEVRPESNRPRLRVRVKLDRYTHLVVVVERIRRLFDLFANPLQISNHLSADSRLKHLAKQRPGLRVPGAWDGFELAVKALLGERLTAAAPISTIERLVRTFGRPIESAIGLTSLFPIPKVLAQADLSRAGICGEEALAIRELAKSVCRKKISFDAPWSNSLPDIRAIHPSHVDYIIMRAFGESDILPFTADELSVFSARLACSPSEFLKRAKVWRPWCTYAAMLCVRHT